MICPSCGEENPEGFRFCGACGAALAEAALIEAEERKLVSVLFVDLVGHTAASDRADPEDVRARLRPYHSLLKREIERYGGTVEKFVGDAVMAVFGAPVSREDDAERAVRSVLRILEAVEELELEVRAAVATGEAVVSLQARPEQGEGIVAGDVVNTTSRLQQAAPPGSLVVGEVTYRATRDAIEYEEFEPVSVKGKADPIAIWRALGARGRLGVDAEAAPRTPFVGRNDDLAVLTSAFARTLRECSAQLVTIVGEPGVGKTRIVAELRRFVDDRPELVFWRQGRCLPYGEGITFWALGEIVKAHAGVLESDDPEAVAAKLERTLAVTVEEDSERTWLRERLLPLVGSEHAVVAEREESFTAWRRFLESVAAERPLVLVVEDLHWADAAMLEFLEHLVDWSSGVPLLLVCTASPELFDRVSGWGGGKRNSTSLSLSPLANDEIARLLSGLLSQAVLPAETQTALLERCGGNPLYAEEFVRMLGDRGILRRREGRVKLASDAEIPVPETVQALIAARLDSLTPGLKTILHDAAVMGKVFWAGAVASVAGIERRDAEVALHELAVRELVRPARLSSVEGDAEYAFWHVLVRDVAYGQIPRRGRIEKHLGAAMWIEELAGERVSDYAEFLAYHYREALGLARAVGASDKARELEPRARRALVMAGDRAARLDMSSAVAYYEEALGLSSPGQSDRGRILTRLAEVRWGVGHIVAAERVASDAVDEYRSVGNRLGEGEALVHLATSRWLLGETARSRELLLEAVGLLEQEPPGPELARASAQLARDEMLTEASEPAIEWADKALPLARSTGMDDQVSLALQARGCSRCMLGDYGGLDDLHEARRLSLDLGLGIEIARSHNNLGSFVLLAEGPGPAHEIFRQGTEAAEQRGTTTTAMWGKAHMLWTLFELGRWDELLELADEVESWSRSSVGMWSIPWRANVLVHRGEEAARSVCADDFLDRVRAVGDPQLLVPAQAIAAVVEQAGGSSATALELILELERTTEAAPLFRAKMLPDAARVCVAVGAVDVAGRLVDSVQPMSPRHRNGLVTARALIAEAKGNPAEAAELHSEAGELWRGYGHVLEHAYALLGAGRCLVILGRPGDAGQALEQAKAIFARLRATPLEAEVDRLVAEAA